MKGLYIKALLYLPLRSILHLKPYPFCEKVENVFVGVRVALNASTLLFFVIRREKLAHLSLIP